MIELTGKLILDDGKSLVVTKKHINQSSWKRVGIVMLNCDVERYYRTFLEKKFNIKLNSTLRGSHVTIINDRIDDVNVYNEYYKLYNKTPIKLYINNEIYINNNKHWWLPVESPDGLEIRKKMGFSEKPHFSFHLTLGQIKSEYLIPNEFINKYYPELYNNYDDIQE